MTDFNALLHILSRFIHISSAVLIIGGVFYGRMVLVPVLNSLPEEQRMPAAAGAQMRFRTTMFALVLLSLISGLYNINFFQTFGGLPVQYHAAFGIKMLAVLHIYATAILWATSPYGDVQMAGKGKRRLASMAIAGLIVILVSAYLRAITLGSIATMLKISDR